MMDKPLKDWTLGELKEYCTGRNCVANECRLDIDGDGFQNCKVRGGPFRWDLSDPPRWTAEDIADAKAVRRLFTWTDSVKRNEYDQICLGNGSEWISVKYGCFPSLSIGETVTLQEILDAEGQENG